MLDLAYSIYHTGHVDFGGNLVNNLFKIIQYRHPKLVY